MSAEIDICQDWQQHVWRLEISGSDAGIFSGCDQCDGWFMDSDFEAIAASFAVTLKFLAPAFVGDTIYMGGAFVLAPSKDGEL